MNKKTQGAWLLHHARKLITTTNFDFDSIAFAGKSGILLSAISANKQSIVTHQRLEALARANYISPKTELPAIIFELERQRLVQKGSNEIEVLGLTTHSVLEHASKIFDENDSRPEEKAVIFLSDKESLNNSVPNRNCDGLDKAANFGTSAVDFRG